jgi:uncharacterized protein (DUF924 family)
VVSTDPLARDILDFWFGPPPLAARNAWFRKDPAFDTAIQTRFGAAVAAARAGAYGEWCHEPHGALARVILLDQFTRSMFRDTADAFSGDARALATAEDAIAQGFDRDLAPLERWFLYMPFEHSEDSAMQAFAGTLRRARDRDRPRLAVGWARRHADVIRRFDAIRIAMRSWVVNRPGRRSRPGIAGLAVLDAVSRWQRSKWHSRCSSPSPRSARSRDGFRCRPDHPDRRWRAALSCPASRRYASIPIFFLLFVPPCCSATAGSEARIPELPAADFAGRSDSSQRPSSSSAT